MNNFIKYFLYCCVLLPSQLVIAANDIVILGLFKDKAIFKLDKKQYSLTPGESIGKDVTLISADSKQAVFEIEGDQRVYTLGSHIGSSFSKFTAEKTVSIAADRNGMFWVNGSINKHQTRFIVDTGATFISMNR